MSFRYEQELRDSLKRGIGAPPYVGSGHAREALEEIDRLRGVIQRLGNALRQGYHSGFCNGPCKTCDEYQAAMALADNVNAQGDSRG